MQLSTTRYSRCNEQHWPSLLVKGGNQEIEICRHQSNALFFQNLTASNFTKEIRKNSVTALEKSVHPPIKHDRPVHHASQQPQAPNSHCSTSKTGEDILMLGRLGKKGAIWAGVVVVFRLRMKRQTNRYLKGGLLLNS